MSLKNTLVILFLFAALVAAVFVFDEFVEQAIPETPVNEKMESVKEQTKTEFSAVSKRKESKVTYVIDGDTVELETGERVRLIGIDAPEFKKPYFTESKAKLAELVLNKNVFLEKDETDRDAYGRLLRYVYQDGVFVNLEMVRIGYAKALIIPPDVKYKDLLLAAELEARRQHLGIWVFR